MARARFSSTDHLSAEAVAALVDGELSPSAERRARAHVGECAECLADVISQQRAADRLRRGAVDDCVHAPSALVERLACLGDEMGAPDPGSRADAAKAVAKRVESAIRSLGRRG